MFVCHSFFLNIISLFLHNVGVRQLGRTLLHFVFVYMFKFLYLLHEVGMQQREVSGYVFVCAVPLILSLLCFSHAPR
jgi:hypothetical protein